MKKKLRSGFTTGACAAAAAKAAVLLLLDELCRQTGVGAYCNTPLRSSAYDRSVGLVEIPFPDGSRVKFKVRNSEVKVTENECISSASVIKDAGDDPDITNGAEIVAEAKLQGSGVRGQGSEKNQSPIPTSQSLVIKGGKGVGIVTKPGLPVPIGEAAINPVPRKMIEEAVMEAVKESLELRVMSYELKNGKNLQLRTLNSELRTIEITISVPNGEELAKKTLNYRLGIAGGISILGTTGIVKPVSTEAWTATIASSMDVAKAMGHREVVLSAGRSSEKAHMKKYQLPEEVYVLMGDHLEFSLKEAERHDFTKVHLCAQWAKMVKIAMATPQTHVRFGAIDIRKAVDFLKASGIAVPSNREYNTAREIFDFIQSSHVTGANGRSPLQKICDSAKNYAERIANNIPVTAYLVSYEGEIIAASE